MLLWNSSDTFDFQYISTFLYISDLLTTKTQILWMEGLVSFLRCFYRRPNKKLTLYITAVATQFSFNNSALNMLPENSSASLNKSFIPSSKLIGLYVGSTRLDFPEDGTGAAPVRVHFDHDGLVSIDKV